MLKIRNLLFASILLSFIGMASAADIHDAVRENNIEMVHRLLMSDSTLADAADEKGKTPLHIAALDDNIDALKVLVDAGADLEIKDNRGSTPLISAISSNSLPIVKYLIEHGADTAAAHYIFGRPVDYSFYIESMDGESGITEFLINYGMLFDPDYDGYTGDCRLFIASWFGRSEMLEFLLPFKPNLNVVRERDGMTALVDAIARGNDQSAVMLIEAGADVKIPDKNGKPAIRYAVEKGLMNSAGALIESGVDLSFLDEAYGRTHLHVAAIRGYLDIVKLLVQSGMNINATDVDGKTAVYYAGKYGNSLIFDYLINNGADADVSTAENFEIGYLNNPPEACSAIAWYLNKRGWVIKTNNHLLIIDSEDNNQVYPTEPSLDNGFLNLSELKDRNIYSIYTGYHGRSADDLMYIHKIKDSLSNVTYIHNKGDYWRGDWDIVYMSDREVKEFPDMQIVAVRPLAPGFFPLLAYLCRVEGLSIFYSMFGTDDLEALKQALDFLHEYTDSIDIAFLPLPDPGKEENSDIKTFLESFNTGAVCILDSQRRGYLFKDMAAKIADWGYDCEVFCAENPGDKFINRRDK